MLLLAPFGRSAANIYQPLRDRCIDGERNKAVHADNNFASYLYFALK